MSTGSTPHRPTWAGFVLVIVPVDDLETDLRPLYRAVAAEVAGDPAMGETVALGLAPEVDGRASEEPATVGQALVSAATRAGGPLAPTVVFGILVVGARRDHADRIANLLAETPRLRRFRVHQFGRSTEEADLTVRDVLDTVDALRAQYERWPDEALSAEDFHAVINGRPPARVEPHSRPAAPASPRSLPPGPAPSRPLPPGPAPSRPAPAEPDASPRPASEHAGEGLADEPAETRRTAWKSAVGRMRSILPQAPPVPRESMDRLAARSTDVALLYLVPAPDLAPVSRATRNRRRDLLLQIDAAFARRGSRDCPYQMSVLAGDRRAGRRSVFVPAGSLSVRTLPKVEVGHFDLAARVDDVLATRERDIASLWRRGTAVVRTDVVLLSTNAPLADIDAVERFQELCAEVRLSWILLDADVELLSDEFESAGAEIFEDHPDVVNALMTAAFAADRPEDANSDPSEDLAADRPEDADFDPPEGFAAGRPEYLAATRPQDEADLAVPGD